MIVTLCYFLKSIKSVFILVQCNTSLSKNYLLVHMLGYSSLRDRLNLRKNLLCLHSLAVCTYEISCRTRDFSTNSHSTTKRLKHWSNFESGESVRSLNVVEFEFELRHIPRSQWGKRAPSWGKRAPMVVKGLISRCKGSHQKGWVKEGSHKKAR